MSGNAVDGDAGAPFDHPYIDVDEWRDTPVRHRYVHGGFTGTETRYSFYLPPESAYGGRFFQHITPVPDSEHLAQDAQGEEDRIGFSVASGAVFVETNGGGVWGGYGSPDPTIAAYRANAACAQQCRAVAIDMYGAHRVYGYAYGGSGGGYRTIGGMENTSGVWDGAVPYVIGSPMAIPNMFTVRMHAQRILRDRLDEIVDAVEPGGSDNPYAGLSDEEQDALREVTRMGFPLRSWFGHRTMGMHAFPVLYQGMRVADPTYFEQFWTDAGYLGADPPDSLRRDVVQLRTTVRALVTPDDAARLDLAVVPQAGQARGNVDTAWRDGDASTPAPVGLRLSQAPAVGVEGADLVVHSGKAAGTRLSLLSVHGEIALLGPGDDEAILRIRPGDEVEVDNRGFLAAQTYHRHQVPPGDDYPVWDQFRQSDGSPRYPQRPLLLGPLFAAAAAGTVQTGRFEGRMIVVASLLDREALPWQADWYRAKVRAHFGPSVDDHLRLWFTDNALHGDNATQEDATHTVSYVGMLHQALRDLSAWVEREVPPPPSTVYEVRDGQIEVPPDASARGGVQPVAELSVNGAARADVRVGVVVTLRATGEVPPGTGAVVALEWDLDGSGTFADHEAVRPGPRIDAERQWEVPAAGTWFPVVRVVAQREGDATSMFARLQNVARVRVVAREAGAAPS